MASSHKSLLEIEPKNELEFYGPFTAVQSSLLKLTNCTNDRVTFKVKTTVPKRYCVRPSCGIVEPSETVNVSVMLQPFECENSEKNKHKFMIQTMVLQNEPAGNLEQIWREAIPSDISDTRLKCTLRMPDDLVKCEPDELVFDGPITDPYTCVLTARNLTLKDLVFKIKTNAPKRYIVQPNEGIIKSRDKAVIQITTVPGAESSPESKDRLSLIAAVATDDVSASLSRFWQTVDKARVYEKLFSCVYPIQEECAPPPSNHLTQLKEEIEKLRKENEDLRCQASVNRLGRTSSVAGPAVAMVQQAGFWETMRANVPPVLYLIITFLFALAVGKFMI